MTKIHLRLLYTLLAIAVLGGLSLYVILTYHTDPISTVETSPTSDTTETTGAGEAAYLVVLAGDTVSLKGSNSTTYSVHTTATNTSLASFLFSQGFALTSQAVGDRSGTVHAESEEEVLQLYVNGELVEKPFHLYTSENGDTILLYHGPNDQAVIDGHLAEVTSYTN